MKIEKICGTFLLISSVFTYACGREPLRKATAQEVAPKIEHAIGLINRTTVNSLSADSSLVKFGVDTLMIDNKLTKNIPRFIQWLNENGRKRIQKIETGYHLETRLTYINGKWMPMPFRVIDYSDKYIPGSVKTLAEKQIYVDKNKNLYLPVEYYGKPNPEAAKDF